MAFYLISVLDHYYLCLIFIMLISSRIPVDIHVCYSSTPFSVLTRPRPNACVHVEYPHVCIHMCDEAAIEDLLSTILYVTFLTCWMTKISLDLLISSCLRKLPLLVACYSVVWMSYGDHSYIVRHSLYFHYFVTANSIPRKASGHRHCKLVDLGFILIYVSMSLGM